MFVRSQSHSTVSRGYFVENIQRSVRMRIQLGSTNVHHHSKLFATLQRDKIGYRRQNEKSRNPRKYSENDYTMVSASMIQLSNIVPKPITIKNPKMQVHSVCAIAL